MVARILHLLLAVLVAIGLAIAPLTSSVAVGHRAADAGMTGMVDMSGDMPCCPDKQKQGDCQDCPLLGICMLKVLQRGPSDLGLSIGNIQMRVLKPLDEPEIAGLTRPPPDQPPRTIV